jgi:hypothetical protein
MSLSTPSTSKVSTFLYLQSDVEFSDNSNEPELDVVSVGCMTQLEC